MSSFWSNVLFILLLVLALASWSAFYGGFQKWLHKSLDKVEIAVITFLFAVAVGSTAGFITLVF